MQKHVLLTTRINYGTKKKKEISTALHHGTAQIAVEVELTLSTREYMLKNRAYYRELEN